MKDKQIDLHRVITVIISIVWMAFQTYIILGKPMNPMLQVPVHLVFALAIIYLYNPIDKKNEKLRKLKFLDYIFYLCRDFVPCILLHLRNRSSAIACAVLFRVGDD